MITAMPTKPVPEPTPESRPYWEGLAEGRLMLQRCADCGRVRHYPRPLCDACHSFATDWVEASGAAVLHSWTVAHHPYHPAFRAEVPYVLATAELAEGVRMVAQLRDAATPRLGMPLRIGFEPAGEGLVLPVLHPAAG